MFKDLPEGQTHFYGDGCQPPHTRPAESRTMTGQDNSLEELLKEFDKEFAWYYSEKAKKDDRYLKDEVIATPQDIKSFITKAYNEGKEEGKRYITSFSELYKKGVKDGKLAENKEWREGRRCEICGEPKQPNLTTMCDSCLQNG